MPNPILDALERSLGETLDTVGSAMFAPGDYYRGLMAGRPGTRVTGKQYLDQYGGLEPDDEFGALKGYLYDIATDPLTALGVSAKVGLPTKAALSESLAPIGKALGQIARDESGYLKFPIPGVSEAMGKAMDAVGPRYPGGVEKLMEIARAADNPGTPLNPATRIFKMIENLGPAEAERLAGEIPPGTKYLGHGSEAMALSGPEGQVIRIGDLSDTPRRARIPEMLQPYRVADVGGYGVEHLPRVSLLPSQEVGGKVAEELAGQIKASGFNPHDVDLTRWFNAGITPEGKAVAFDPGAITPGRVGVKGAFKPFPTYVENPARLKQSLGAGGPELVRESLRKGLQSGTQGQGVDLPSLESLLRQNPNLLNPEG